MRTFLIPAVLRQAPAPKPEPASQRTPGNVRQQHYKAGLLASGGRRVAVNLLADAVSDLEAIQARDQLTGKGSATQAIVAALRAYAGRAKD